MAMGSGGKVLVVDDDEDMRESLKGLLDAAGYETVAYDSAEALLKDEGIAGGILIVSDMRLPARSGLEMLAELRARGERIPLIAITAHAEPGVREGAERAGATACLTKPFPGSGLLAAIERGAGANRTK